MNIDGKKLGLIAGILALLLVLVASSCAPSVVPQKEVIIGYSGSLTGPLATVGVPAFYGTSHYVNYVNEQGGLDGIPVKIIWEDTASVAPRASTTHKRLITAGAPVILEILSMSVELMASHAQKAEVPITFEGPYTPAMITPGERWVFSAFGGYGPWSATSIKWIRDNWTESRPPRIGAMGVETASAYGFFEGLDYAASQGWIDYLGYSVIPLFGCIDTSTDWLRWVREEADWIWCYGVGAPAVVLAKDQKRLEIQGQGIDIMWAEHTDEKILQIVGDDCEGTYIARVSPLATEQGAMIATIREVAKKYRPYYETQNIVAMYFDAWIQAYMAVEAARQAIDKVGLDNLTGREMRDSLANLTIDTGFTPVATMSDQRPYAMTQLRICRVDQGPRIIPVTDWLEFVYTLEME